MFEKYLYLNIYLFKFFSPVQIFYNIGLEDSNPEASGQMDFQIAPMVATILLWRSRRFGSIKDSGIQRENGFMIITIDLLLMKIKNLYILGRWKSANLN